MLWLTLGIPLSWSKGADHPCGQAYQWIGVVFQVARPGVARISLPEAFVNELVTLCDLFLRTNRQPRAKADALVGKAGRVACVLPEARPFVSSLYAAMAAALRAQSVGAREAPPGHVVCRRFRRGARMLRRILGCTDRQRPIPNSRELFAVRPPPPDPARRRIEVDASPWGAGAVLVVEGKPVQCFAYEWQPHDFEGMRVTIGDCTGQTFFELVGLIMAVEVWCSEAEATAIIGDNVGSLQELLDLRGRGLHERPAQVLAVLRCSRSLDLAVGHLPTESNLAADALSRQAGPKGERKPWPFTRRQRVPQTLPKPPVQLWKLLA